MSFRPASVDGQGEPTTSNGGGSMPLAEPGASSSHVTGKRHWRAIHSFVIQGSSERAGQEQLLHKVAPDLV